MNVRLVQSGRFPNLWSLIGVDDPNAVWMFRDPIFVNGAMSAENAVVYARENGHTIVAIDAGYEGPADSWQEVIAGIEYRSERPVLDLEDDEPEVGVIHEESPDPDWMNP